MNENKKSKEKIILATQDENSNDVVITIGKEGQIARIQAHLKKFLLENLGIQSFARQVVDCGSDIGVFESFLVKEVNADAYYRIYSRQIAASESATGNIETIDNPKDLKTFIYALVMEGYLGFDSFSLKRKGVKYNTMSKIAFVLLGDSILDMATNDALIIDIEGHSTLGYADYSHCDTENVDNMVTAALERGIFDTDPRAEKQESPYNVFGHEVIVNKAKGKSYQGKPAFKNLNDIDDRSHIEHSILLSKDLSSLLRKEREGHLFHFEYRKACSVVDSKEVYNWSGKAVQSAFLRPPIKTYDDKDDSDSLALSALEVSKSRNADLIATFGLALNHYYFNIHNEGVMIQKPASVIIPISKPTDIQNERNEVLSKIHTDIKVGALVVNNAIVYDDGSEMDVALFKLITRPSATPNSIVKSHTLVVSTKTKAKSAKHKVVVIHKSENRDALVNKMVETLYQNCSIDDLSVVLDNIKSSCMFYGEPNALNVNIGNF